MKHDNYMVSFDNLFEDAMNKYHNEWDSDFSNVDRIFSQFGSRLIGRTFRVVETIDCSVPINSYLRSVRLSSYLYPKYERFHEKDYLEKVDRAFEEFEESL